MAQFTIQGGDGQQFGPVDADTLVGWAQERRIGPTTQVYDHHTAKWIEANNLDVLKSAWATSTPSHGQPPTVTDPTMPFATAFELKPLRLGELLDQTFRLYRKNFVNFFLIALVTSIISVILSDTIYASFGVFGVVTGDMAMATQKILQVNLANFFTFVIVVPVQTILFAAMTIAVSKAYLGLEFNLMDCYRSGLSRFGELMWTSILAILFVVLGLIALIIPGVYLMISYLLASIVVVLEGLKGRAALKRSRELLRKKTEKGFFRNNIWKISVIGLVYFAIASVIWMMTNIPGIVMGFKQAFAAAQHEQTQAFPIWMVLLSQSLSILSTAATAPIGSIGIILLYYDIRIRFEGFDLQMLAQAVRQTKNK